MGPLFMASLLKSSEFYNCRLLTGFFVKDCRRFLRKIYKNYLTYQKDIFQGQSHLQQRIFLNICLMTIDHILIHIVTKVLIFNNYLGLSELKTGIFENIFPRSGNSKTIDFKNKLIKSFTWFHFFREFFYLRPAELQSQQFENIFPRTTYVHGLLRRHFQHNNFKNIFQRLLWFFNFFFSREGGTVV